MQIVLANPFSSKGSRKRAAAKAAHTRDLEKLVQLVTAHLGARRGSSSINTLLAYRKGIRAFLEFVSAETRVEIVQVDDESIQGFRNGLIPVAKSVEKRKNER